MRGGGDQVQKLIKFATFRNPVFCAGVETPGITSQSPMQVRSPAFCAGLKPECPVAWRRSESEGLRFAQGLELHFFAPKVRVRSRALRCAGVGAQYDDVSHDPGSLTQRFAGVGTNGRISRQLRVIKIPALCAGVERWRSIQRPPLRIRSPALAQGL